MTVVLFHVIPVQTGIYLNHMDSCFRRNDKGDHGFLLPDQVEGMFRRNDTFHYLSFSPRGKSVYRVDSCFRGNDKKGNRNDKKGNRNDPTSHRSTRTPGDK